MLEQSKIDHNEIEDFVLGCAFPEAEQGTNIARMASIMAGFPDTVPAMTINRLCASGLESIVIAANKVTGGRNDLVIAGGVESMSFVPMFGNVKPHPVLEKTHPELYMSMGITAENIASRYNVSRTDQDVFALNSHLKAAHAKFDEIIPTPAIIQNADNPDEFEEIIQEIDDGVRAASTLEGLAKLKTVFLEDGTVTAGNSSQMSDGASACIVASKKALDLYKLRPIAKLKHYTVVGCKADEMGVGPIYAVPKLLRETGLKIADIGLWEINEAFAVQALYCAREIGLGEPVNWSHDSNKKKLNISGGAIALGHPLGCTGNKLTATLLSNMQKLDVKYGIVTLCVGGGMGVAALFELCD
jgi:acetyl-CoA acyltransferase